MQKFISKQVIIQAIQWNGNTNRQEIFDFVGETLKTEEFSTTAYEAGQGLPYFILLVNTKYGQVVANPKDYIIKLDNGDILVLEENSFKENYEEYNEVKVPIYTIKEEQSESTQSESTQFTSFGKNAVYLDTSETSSLSLKTKIADLIDEIELFRNKQKEQYAMIKCSRAVITLIEIDRDLFMKGLTPN